MFVYTHILKVHLCYLKKYEQSNNAVILYYKISYFKYNTDFGLEFIFNLTDKVSNNGYRSLFNEFEVDRTESNNGINQTEEPIRIPHWLSQSITKHDNVQVAIVDWF